jgi:superfamily II DNA or RNA helicase
VRQPLPDVTIASVPTLAHGGAPRPPSPADAFDLVIVDEAHHGVCDQLPRR